MHYFEKEGSLPSLLNAMLCFLGVINSQTTYPEICRSSVGRSFLAPNGGATSRLPVERQLMSSAD